MKIAYIVQCHRNPKQLNLLFYQLLKQNCDVYVHIDKKVTDIDSLIISHPNLFVLPFNKRVKVGWGGISQVEASLQLIKCVVESHRQYDYVWLISGQDFPIQTQSHIIDFLKDNIGKCFIDCDSTETKRYVRLLKRNEVMHSEWISGKGTFQKIVRNVWYIVSGGRCHTFKLFKRRLNSDKFYFGSSWWCLPFECCKEMLAYLQEDTKFYHFFRHCHCPDESFFQTLLMNHTSFKNKVERKLVYVDWTGCENSPRTLTESDYSKIIGGGYMFARKFDLDIDQNIVKIIERDLNNELQ